MDFDKILAYLLSISGILSGFTAAWKNIHDMRKGKNKKKRRTPGKKKRRK
ncbi:hypothetical protein [Lysinibacillus odysseyi]|nr:hypothetical protein [Lysinibacillus odysseyi]